MKLFNEIKFENKNFKINLPRKIKRLCLGGGGARGLVYGDVYKWLMKNGKLNDLDEVAGISAGSLCALFIALGVSPKKLMEIIDSIDYKKLTQNVSFKKKGIFSLSNMEGILRENVLEALNARIKEAFELITQNNTLEGFKKASLTASLISLNIEQPTFRDLKILKEVFQALEINQIKDLLVLTAATRENTRLIEFNPNRPIVCSHHTTPDLPLIAAVLASSAIPLVFERPVISVDNKEFECVDGGPGVTDTPWFREIPIGFESKLTQRVYTLMLLLKPLKEVYPIIYSTEGLGFKIGDSLMRLGKQLAQKVTLTSFLEAYRRTQDDLKVFGPCCICLDVELPMSLSFQFPLKTVEDMKKRAIERLKEYYGRKNERWDLEYYYIEGDAIECLLKTPFDQLKEAKKLLLEQCNESESDSYDAIIDSLIQFRINQKEIGPAIIKLLVQARAILMQEVNSKEELGEVFKELSGLIQNYLTLPSNIHCKASYDDLVFDSLFNGINYLINLLLEDLNDKDLLYLLEESDSESLLNLMRRWPEESFFIGFNPITVMQKDEFLEQKSSL